MTVCVHYLNSLGVRVGCEVVGLVRSDHCRHTELHLTTAATLTGHTRPLTHQVVAEIHLLQSMHVLL